MTVNVGAWTRQVAGLLVEQASAALGASGAAGVVASATRHKAAIA